MYLYKLTLLLLLISFNFSACKSVNQAANTTSEETTISTENEQNKPLKINENKRFVKHREVNRRIVHRSTRLHR